VSGVADVDVEGKQVTVIYDPSKTSPQKIVSAIVSSGVDSVSKIEPQ
jgi:copper chaperone CopZ